MDASVKSEQEEMTADVLASMQLVDTAINHCMTGWLQKHELKTALRGFFQVTAWASRVGGGGHDARPKVQPGWLAAEARAQGSAVRLIP